MQCGAAAGHDFWKVVRDVVLLFSQAVPTPARAESIAAAVAATEFVAAEHWQQYRGSHNEAARHCGYDFWCLRCSHCCDLACAEVVLLLSFVASLDWTRCACGQKRMW